MRILMLTQFYPPVLGGEERHVRALSIELVSRGHDVAVVTLRQEGQAELEIDQGVRVYRVRGSMQRATFLFSNKGLRYSPPFPDPEALLSMRRVILHERPNIVHAHNWIVYSFLPLKAWSKAKLVVSLHDHSMVCATKQLVQKGTYTTCSGPALPKCLKCAAAHYGATKGMTTMLINAISARAEQSVVDMFIAVSQAVVEGTQLVKYKVKYRVISNFVPNELPMIRDDESPLLAQLPREDYLLFAGDISHNKGVPVLLRAYAEMGSQIPLVLIGQPMMDFSVDLPPNVLVLQSWPHAALMSAWRRCMIGLVPSVCQDSCPTVVMEAMAFGKPVVASRVGGLPDIVSDGETGLLVPPGDVHALRDAVQSLVDDPARRERMGAMAKQRAIKFQAREVVPCIEQVYQEILHS